MITQKIKHSSQILQVSYDTDSKELQVDFISGASYVYFNVPPDIYTGIITAHSAGSYFNENIKKQFDYKKV